MQKRQVIFEDEKWTVELYNKALEYGLKQYKAKADESFAYDFAGWIIEKLPKKRAIKLRWYYIDYLRHTYGDSRSPGSVQRRNVESPLSTDDLDESFGFDIAAEFRDPGDAIDQYRQSFNITGSGREIKEAILRCVLAGVKVKSVASGLNLSEGRVNQILNEVTNQKYQLAFKEDRLKKKNSINKTLIKKLKFTDFTEWMTL